MSISTGSPTDADRRDLAWALARARRVDPDVHPSAFDFLEYVLLGGTRRRRPQELSRTAALRFAMKLQQFSGPVMAKGVEDRRELLHPVDRVWLAARNIHLGATSLHQRIDRRDHPRRQQRALSTPAAR